MIGMRDNSLKHWLVQEYSNAVIWLVRETHSKEQSDSREQYTTLWEKNLKEDGSWEEVSESSWSYECNPNQLKAKGDGRENLGWVSKMAAECNPNQLKAKSDGRENLGWVNKMAAEAMYNWNRLQVNL